MAEKMTQEQRLDTLVEAFKADSVHYKDLQTPEDNEGKRRILRSLMNICMPKKLDDHKGQIDRVIFNVFKDEDKAYYEKLLQ